MAGFGPITSATTSTGTSISNGAQYVIPNRRVTSKTIPSGASPAPGDNQARFAFEQMIHELAHAANMDPSRSG